MRVWTIGHSTREPGDFIALLAREGVTLVADVRRFPGSRRVPWTAGEALAPLLRDHGIGYVHLPELGGKRKARPDTPNAGWENEGFRGYADHMATPEFERGLQRLLALADQENVAVMCAEAVPWRCHRGLLADALLVRGVEVAHVMDAGARPATLTAFARVRGTSLTYPPAGGVQQRL